MRHLLFFLITSFLPFIVNCQFLGTISASKISFTLGKKPIICNNAHYFISKDNKSIVRLNETTQQLITVYTSPSNRIINNLLSTEKTVVFTLSNSNSITNIMTLNQSGNSLELIEFESSNYLKFITLENNILYTCLKNETASLSEFYKFNIETFITELLFTEDSLLLVSGIKNGRFLYTRAEGNQNCLVAKNNIDEKVILTGNFTSCDLVETNDSSNIYYVDQAYLYSGSTWKIDTLFTTNKFYSSYCAGTLYFNNGKITTTPHGNFNYENIQYITYEVNDTLGTLIKPNLTENYQVEFNQHTLSTMIPSPYFVSKSVTEGTEICRLNDSDSLEVINEESVGWISSVAGFYCPNDATLNTNQFFEWNGQFYFLEINKNGKTYLSKITDTTFIKIVEMKNNSQHALFNIINSTLSWYTYSYDLKSYSFYSRPISVLNEIANETDETDEWMTELVLKKENKEYFYCDFENQNLRVRKSLVDENKNVYVFYRIYFSNQPGSKNSTIFNSKDRNQDSLVNTNVLVKIDSLGHLIWMNTFGNKYGEFIDDAIIFMQSDGKIAVFGEYFYTGRFDNDSLTRLDQGPYFAQIDVQTGKFISKKNLFTSEQFPFLFNRKIIQDKSGDFYFSSSYDYKIDLTDTVLYSDITNQNVLIKLNEKADFLWAKNVLNNWTDYAGEISELQLDETYNTIYLLCVQNPFTSCNNDRLWNAELISFDLVNGVEKRRIKFGGRIIVDKSIKMLVLPNNQVKIIGQFVEELTAQYLSGTTSPIEDCFEAENFELIYDHNLNQIVSGFQSQAETSFYPLQILNKENEYYILAVNNFNLFILRYNQSGDYLGEKYISNNIFNDVSNFNFDYKDGYFTLIGTGFESTVANQFIPQLSFYNPVIVSRFQIFDWDYKPRITFPLKTDPKINTEIAFLFPNPSKDIIDIYCNLKGETIIQFTVQDMSGKTIINGIFDKQQHLRLSLTNYSAGLYFFNINNGEQNQTIKFVKL